MQETITVTCKTCGAEMQTRKLPNGGIRRKCKACIKKKFIESSRSPITPFRAKVKAYQYGFKWEEITDEIIELVRQAENVRRATWGYNSRQEAEYMI